MEVETRYAISDDVRVAYQVVGDGPRDLVLVPGFVSHLELAWEYPPYERFLRRLARFARVIVFDKRGSGLSDPVAETATIEERMDDIRAVMDAAGSERADVFGWSEGATIAAVFGASRPDRVSALVLYGSFARGTPAEGYPWAVEPDTWRLWLREDEEETWGQGFSLMILSPSLFEDQAVVRWWGRFERQSMSPNMSRAAMRLDMELDIRSVLPSIRVRTLVIHRTGDVLPVEGGRWLAEQVPAARFVELPGDDHWPWTSDPDEIVDEVAATFDGPARGIQCAKSIGEQVRPLGMEIRAGLHTGECEVRDGDIGGIAVHIGARVASVARPGEVLVSGTVKDLVVGSALRFIDRGTHNLKGAPGEWHLYAVGSSEPGRNKEPKWPAGRETSRGGVRSAALRANDGSGSQRCSRRVLSARVVVPFAAPI